MVWTWRYEKSDGSAVELPGGTEEFPTQGDAESWIGESWRELLDGGVDQVVLLEDGAKVYGPMVLHPAESEGRAAEAGGDGSGAAES